MRRLATLALLLLVVASIARAAEPPPPGLGHDHPLTGRIWNVAQGRFVAMNALAAAVSAARFALLGERHDHPEHHEFQAWLLRRMLESGRRPAVAFEMLDTTQAPALARHLATSPPDGAGLLAGGGHVRTDQGGPRALAVLAPDAGVASVAFLEVVDGWTAPADYAARFGAARLPFDYAWFTARADNADHCARLRERARAPSDRPSPAD